VSFFQLLAKDFSFFFTKQLEDKFVSKLGYVTIMVGSCERQAIVVDDSCNAVWCLLRSPVSFFFST
jgi:hypothetical protein